MNYSSGSLKCRAASHLDLLIDVVFQVEVFNVLFIREQEKRHVVHCIDCARKQAPGLEGFVCLEEYKLGELKDVYDNFSLHSGAVSRFVFLSLFE